MFCIVPIFLFALTGCVEEAAQVIFVPVAEESFGCGGCLLLTVLMLIGISQCSSGLFNRSQNQATQQQIAAPAPAPYAPPAEVPVEAPVVEPIESPVEAPVEAPVESPIESPASAPAEAPSAGGIKFINASTNNQELPPGTKVQVLIYDDYKGWHEINVARINYHDYQLNIELVEPIPEGTRYKVNWFPVAQAAVENSADSYGGNRFMYQQPYMPVPQNEREYSHRHNHHRMW